MEIAETFIKDDFTLSRKKVRIYFIREILVEKNLVNSRNFSRFSPTKISKLVAFP